MPNLSYMLVLLEKNKDLPDGSLVSIYGDNISKVGD